MIVAKLYKPGGSPGSKPNVLAHGSCEIERYSGKTEGWFPVESFDFGFTDSERDALDDKNPATAPKPAPARPAGGGGGGPHPGGKGGQKKKDFAQLTIAKQIDTATGDLMQLAMEERQTKKGSAKEQETKIHADIHVLATVQIDRSSEKYVYPVLLIHLEAVNVLGWKVQASGDGRPTESLTIRYDRAAMMYVGMKTTENGTEWNKIGPRGWDQTKNDKFDSSTWSDWKSFVPPDFR